MWDLNLILYSWTMTVACTDTKWVTQGRSEPLNCIFISAFLFARVQPFGGESRVRP